MCRCEQQASSNDRPGGSDLNERNGGNRLPDENGHRGCEIDGAFEDQHRPAVSQPRGSHPRQDRKCAVRGEVGREQKDQRCDGLRRQR